MAAKSMENDMTAYYDFFYSYNNEPGQVWSLAHTHPTFKIQFCFKWA